MKSKDGGSGSNGGGFAPIVIVAIVAVVAIGGYFALQKSGKAPSLSLPAMVALNDKCKYNDPDLCKYFNRTLSGDYFKGSMTMKGIAKDKSGKVLSETLVESEGENSHVLVSLDGKEMTNTITIGKTVYVKDQSDGKWWKQTPEDEEKPETEKMERSFDPKELAKEFKEEADKTTFKKIGKEACGDMTCFKYQMINPAFADVTEYLYFDDREYILRKMVTVAKDGMISESTFEFGKASIKEPSPTKDVPEGQNIYMMSLPGGGMMNSGQKNGPQGGPSQEDVEKMMKEFQDKYQAPDTSADQ
ncbi:hypothetical protein A3B50_03465 [Candidatus Roizmanbacteria bacterium RIFCSPLOWO2_01_FULL_40_42]|uniref:Uncharacterized protein n=1 Tax=Candidatus Roizmanbacteria bacterium RIFCSPLOWO2_01_FULL_40_42 TaxID=1802066 RepID=A0A1F7J529_9BACT|nr:MAG: hypothetical protein A2779_00575 [Candidatus Roizmanbacteria bacterium RIFCSPHIGHO2_01_FULL_40_98]OGK28640.1 MAG: hypothetical protein A3C31_05200 [Candidatus Roizmanbacteria bacterium RIFCSPHIGHO2_02_FULL_40_53]OGK30024.1 MAG: hypothetical protein A2W49_01465 [Candidatus Roizmanbacteria bacterium RIFCSPHIGHO2_12_41_18]OGK36775.1 MAG: hypothetical protein A3E69_01720 [Candidatus Roizmanbacteria bacterium RIFCSPHIGHO2_12_FULL_40_130]OGK50699.1 MAG: hypothetical protein A3B50_03465 [Candi